MRTPRLITRRLAKLSAYAALGPITGPLVAGIARSLRNGDVWLAVLYTAAIPAAFSLLTVAGAWAAGAN